MAKEDITNAKRIVIDKAHDGGNKSMIGLLQYGRNMAYTIRSAFNCTLKCINKLKHV